MTHKEALQEAAKSYAYEHPAICRDYCGGFYCDYDTPYRDFMAGAEYDNKTTIDKACEWLVNNINNYIINDKSSGKDWLKVKSEMFDDFRKAMEE